MTFFPDERAAELRDLFFESSQDLLQELNEAGILWKPILRTPRRWLASGARCIRSRATLRPVDSSSLSELAHDIEDVLTPTLVGRTGRSGRGNHSVRRGHFSCHAGRASRQPAAPRHHRTSRAHPLPRGQPQSPRLALNDRTSRACQVGRQRPATDPRRIRTAREDPRLSIDDWQVDSSLGKPAAALQPPVRAALRKMRERLSPSIPSAGRFAAIACPAVHAALSRSSHPSDWIRSRCAMVPSIVSGDILHALSH